MIPLMAVSVVMWVLIINRAVFFRRLYIKNMTRVQAGKHVQENQKPDPRIYKGAVALLVTEFINRRSKNPELDLYILDETVVTLVSALDRFLSLIGMLAGIAPLLGLLGTVTGMLVTFDVISVFGTGNARAMAGGISEALISTQTGLLIAIPGLYMANFLKRRAEQLKQRIAGVGIYLKPYV
jgi:biopolymer transport protein ExbB